ncbi:MAG: hypothetical protein IKT52_06690 [Oscillospiraceae bacterium]|nr:hypothetical protein [Oscillospiraceae bacterium]
MNKQNRRTAIGAALGMLILILDGKTALTGAAEGISLCFNTLIPSLFPFFLLSILLTGALAGQTLPLLQPVTASCKMPKGAESLLVVSLLGGYPVGAQNIALMHRHGQLTNSDAARMLAFCNNAGPAFIFGILGTMFSSPKAPWLLWLIHMASALIVGLLLPGEKNEGRINSLSNKIHITDALAQSVKVMSLVCGWVIIMRMVLSFLEIWFLWLLPLPLQVIVSGILELSNGCIRLTELDCEGLRFLAASGFLSLGGICVTLQTASVADGITMKLYFPGKILQSGISILLAYLFQFTLPAGVRYHCTGIAVISTAVIIIVLSIFQRFKKSSGIPAFSGV